ncbi:MAG: hypothetical protein ACRD4R_12555 [Candidatus Acidiferrales bacterium]
MQPKDLNFGGGAADSAVYLPILVLVLVAGVLICVLPRRKAIAPFLAAGILVPFNQVLVLGGAHFQMIRLLAVFGFVRILWAKFSGKDKIFSGGMNGIDWAVIVLTIFTLIDGALLWQSQAEMVFQVGSLITVLGVYFLARHLLQDWDDVRQALKVLACVIVPIALLMVYEHITGDNPYYGLIGGARNFSAAIGRADIFRARGVFAHPILAGAFGGFMMPLFVGWWWKEKAGRKWAALGVLGATVIPFMTGSSTALFAFLGGFGALCLWPLRRQMRMIRWGVVGVLVAGQLYMTSPVWHIISDVRLSADSSSYHRYQLVNQCIIHFWDWAMIGTKAYASWGWDMWDLSNQYVGTADTGGLIPLLALLAILVFGFKYIGKMRKQVEGDKQEERFIWAVGASLFANLVAFWGIGYFDQIILPWYALLAMIAAVTLAARKPHEAMAPAAATPGGLGLEVRPVLNGAAGLAGTTARTAMRGRPATPPAAVKDTPGKNWMVLPADWRRRNH